MDWLVRAMGLPNAFLFEEGGGGVIQDTASSAVLCALIAAREKVTDGKSNENGVPGNLTVYITEHTHSSVLKAAMIAGIGRSNVRQIPVDNHLSMDGAKLRNQIIVDKQNGFLPTFVCATVGTTSTLAIDPVAEIGNICSEHDLWLHVDAAMLGTAALCPEHRRINDGLEMASSYCFNPHKWMLTNLDCSALYVAK